MAVVCPSVCPVLRSNSRMEGRRKLKIGGQEAHKYNTSDPWCHLEVERSKVKVSRPINAEKMENAPYLPKRKPTNSKLATEMEYDDPHHRHARWPQRSKVKVITSRPQFDACLPITWHRKVAEAPTLAGKMSVPRLTFRTSSKVKGHSYQAALSGCWSHHL